MSVKEEAINQSIRKISQYLLDLSGEKDKNKVAKLSIDIASTASSISKLTSQKSNGTLVNSLRALDVSAKGLAAAAQSYPTSANPKTQFDHINRYYRMMVQDILGLALKEAKE